MTRIAFIGLGTMGSPMASVLRTAGHAILGMDVSPSARQAFEGSVAPNAESLHQVDAIVTMLPDGPSAAQVYEELIWDGARPGTLLIDCSTIDVRTARRLAEEAAARGMDMVDAPVSGGPAGAASGNLSFMVGGSTSAFERAEPVLRCMGNRITRFGEASAGQAAKACHNLIVGITAMGVFEGFALADALGLDLERFYKLCASAAAQSWVLENRCPIPGLVPEAPSSRGFAPGFSAALMAKDLRLALEAANRTKQRVPFGSQAADLFTAFAEDRGTLDFSAIYTTLRDLPDEKTA